MRNPSGKTKYSKPWPTFLARLESENPLRHLPHVESHARFEHDAPVIVKRAFTCDLPYGRWLRYESCEFGAPSASEEAARDGADSLVRPFRIVLTLGTPEVPNGKTIELFADLPVPTTRGTLIRFGGTTTSEWAPLAQLVRRPGLHLSEERVANSETVRRVARVQPLIGSPLTLSLRSQRGRSRLVITPPVRTATRFVPLDRFLLSGLNTQQAGWCCDPGWVLGEAARADLTNRLSGKAGPSTHLVKDDVTALVHLLVRDWPGADDGQHLERQRVMLLGDYMERALYKGAHRVAEALKRRRIEADTLPWVFAGAVDKALEPVWGKTRTPLAERLEDLNPLSLLSAVRKVTMCGPGGLSPEALVREQRDVHYSHLGRLCPIETPESDRLGLTLFLATHAAVDTDGRVVTPLRQTNGKSAGAAPPGFEDAMPVGAVREVPALVAWNGKTARQLCAHPLDPQHSSRPLTRMPAVPASKDGERLVRSSSGRVVNLSWPGQTLGISTSLIPFVAHDDGARTMMGAKNMKQAMPLLEPEAPEVLTGFERLVPDAAGQVVRAVASGLVIAVRQGERVDVTVREKNGTERAYSSPTRRPGQTGGDTEFVARVGLLDHVTRGQVLAEGPGSADGVLALGRNLLVAYMPWYGYNFEDGIVVSDVAAKALTARHAKRIVVPIWPGRDHPRLRPMGPEATDRSAALDAEGFIRVGSNVSMGTTLVRLGRSAVVAWQGIRGNVRHVHRQRFMAGGTPAAHYPQEVVTIDLVDEAPLAVGDKLMGRHGNKGVVTLILPQSEMPRLEDGTPIDVLLNPHGVVGRMNLGQLFETHLGLLAWHARRSGKPISFVVPPFVGLDEKWLFDELKKASFPEGKARVVNPRLGCVIDSPVTVGLQYILRLNHNAADKIAWRTKGRPNRLTLQAPRGRVVSGGQRFGEMEGWALLSHGVPGLLREMTMKADGLLAGSNVPRWPATVEMLFAHLRGLGLEVVVCFGRTTLSMLDRRAIRRLLRGDGGVIDLRIASPKVIRSWSSGIVKQARSFSRGATTTEYRCQTCGKRCSAGDYKKLARNSQDRIDKGEIKTRRIPCGTKECRGTSRRQTESGFLPVKGSLFDEAMFGRRESDEYRTKFGHVKIATPLVHPWTYQSRGPLSEAWSESGYTKRQLKDVLDGKSLEGKYGLDAIRCALGAAFKPEWTITLLPVIPAIYREGRDRTRVESRTIGGRYARFVATNQRVSTKKALAKPETFAALQGALERLFGWSQGQEGSITARLGGKQGLLRQHILGKRVDCSARAVIAPEPSIGIDEVGLPRRMFDAFATAIAGFLNDPVVLVNRAPTLHRYSFRSGVAFPHDRGDVILIHPLTCGPMNADFDGDTIGIHVPLDEVTRGEARHLLPSRQSLSVANGENLFHVAQDMLTGLCLAAIRGELPDAFLKNTKGAVASELRSAAKDGGAVAAAVQLSAQGFVTASEMGLTLGITDIEPPTDRERRVIVAALSRNPSNAKDVWKRLAEGKQRVPLTNEGGAPNSLGVMVKSGGRGDAAQVGQLRAARGVVTSASGQALPHVIAASFRDGVPELEYFYAAHGTRKTMGDKKLITGPAGELTRWLVEAAYEFRVVGRDCARLRKQAPGLLCRVDADGERVMADLLGRVLARPTRLVGARLPVNTVLTATHVAKLPKQATLWLRSPITCGADDGVCQLCYGTDLSTGQLPHQGVAVGIIAAQAVGEQGTQLSMRTFHGAGGGTDIGAARRLFCASEAEKNTTFDAFIRRVTQIYGWKPVNRRHIEVIFRCMHDGEELVGIERRAKSRTRGVLARASFVGTADVLADVAFGPRESRPGRVGSKDRLMLGLATSGEHHGTRRRVGPGKASV